MKTQSGDILGRDTDYLKHGFEHYVAGRFAFLNRFHSSGLMFHQAFEWIMKGGLIKHESTVWDEKHLKGLDHKLINVWDSYTGLMKLKPSKDLREQIVLLDRWYQMKYPIFKDGKPNALMMVKKFHSPHLNIDGEQNSYFLALDMIDKIFHYLSQTWAFDPLVILPLLQDDGLELFYEENPYWQKK